MWHDISVGWYDFDDGIESLYITYNLSDMYLTYNLSDMYDKASRKVWYKFDSLGAYLNWKKVWTLWGFFKDILIELLRDPKGYKKLNPENWWWSYDGLVKNITKLLIASKEHPKWKIYDSY